MMKIALMAAALTFPAAAECQTLQEQRFLAAEQRVAAQQALDDLHSDLAKGHHDMAKLMKAQAALQKRIDTRIADRKISAK